MITRETGPLPIQPPKADGEPTNVAIIKPTGSEQPEEVMPLVESPTSQEAAPLATKKKLSLAELSALCRLAQT